YDAPAGRASLHIQSSLVEESQGFGISVAGSDVAIEGTLVRDTLPSPLDDTAGVGLLISDDYEAPETSSVQLRSSAIERSHVYGVSVTASELDMEKSAVRDVLPRASDGASGGGVIVGRYQDHGASATIRESLIERVHDVGVVADGAEVTLEGTRIADV